MSENFSKTYIFGLPFPMADKSALHAYLSKVLSGDKAVKIFTPNAEILYKASRSPSLSELLRSADLLLPDGIGVVAASRLLGDPLPCRITGIDTAEFILKKAEQLGLSIYLLGGKEGVAYRAALKLKSRFPRLLISGAHHGYFSSEKEKSDVIAHIMEKKPQILFICLGFPDQEKFIVESSNKIPSLRLSIGLGGSLDVWSGDKNRAPKTVQRLGLEWLYRILSEPRRLSRLPYLLGFAAAVIGEKIKRKRKPFSMYFKKL